MRIGKKFLDNYFSPDMSSVLEIGSFDVNGSLKSVKPQAAEWVGVDIEDGPGVDIVVPPGAKLPFPDAHFDLVVATSVFEHDPAFWNTLAEMARVVKKSGFLYICAPSNGLVHRYPLDCFRFYPDASQSFLEIVKQVSPEAVLSESFVGEQDHEQLWNDYVAVIGLNPLSVIGIEKIHLSEACSNIWDGEVFIESSFVEPPEDRRKTELLSLSLTEANTRLSTVTAERDAVTAERDAVTAERDAVTAERDALLRTKLFRWTKSLRAALYRLRRFLGKN